MKKETVTSKKVKQELFSMMLNVRDDKEFIPQAKEMANLAGKIINQAKVDLEDNKYRKSKRKDPYLHS
jgi:hypothetical protein